MGTNAFCVYKDKVGCKSCKHLVFAECKDFATWHRRWLLQDLTPLTNFVFSKDAYYPDEGVVWVSGTSKEKINRLKSACINYCLKNNKKVRWLNTDMVMSRELKFASDTPYDAEVFYIVHDRVENFKVDTAKKVSSVIESYIHSAIDFGCKVFLESRFPYNEVQNWKKL